MEGQGVSDLSGKDYNEGKGTLAQLLQDPLKAPRFAHLRNAQANGRCAKMCGYAINAKASLCCVDR